MRSDSSAWWAYLLLRNSDSYKAKRLTKPRETAHGFDIPLHVRLDESEGVPLRYTGTWIAEEVFLWTMILEVGKASGARQVGAIGHLVFGRSQELEIGLTLVGVGRNWWRYVALARAIVIRKVTRMGFTNAFAEARRRMLAVAMDMFPEKCEPYIESNPIKGKQEKDETKVHPGIRRFVWDHLQDIKDLLRRFLVYNITASGPKSILAVPKVTILGFRCGAYGRKPDPAKTDKISQWPTPLRTTTEFKKEVLAITHCLKPFQAYLFGRRFILRQFDYKIKRIAGIRNKADGLSRVCITPEGMEEAEPIDAFLEYKGGTLAVDNETMSEDCESGELLIRTLEKGAPAVVAKFREGPVTTRGRKEEKDSWGATVGPKDELIAMVREVEKP
ncbi:hypothetical protein CBR_g12676 [Chara braunii]|uniref:Uncharacterized protein n=1 Tax=Chara braunii TaxID=69332 RepID=A0A388KSD8_CHABU|nr:hypothetical protein CBR_g12676 [Chara braunii]|eukprot:GBG72957.1 hypothetical protein CBR_g12676 [Chara braunii]